MATRSTEAVPISGRVDRAGRLIAADLAFERLQVEAGSALGQALALPQIAALARAAASLGVPLSRAVVAADSNHDLDLFIRAEPAAGDDGDILLTIERWVARPMAGPRLALVADADADDERRASDAAALEFETDAALNLVEVSPALASRLGVEPGAARGRPLTSLFRLVEEQDGAMPLIAALATRAPVDGQQATARSGGEAMIIDADPRFGDDGRFIGFSARIRGPAAGTGSDERAPAMFEESLDEALRSPLARIIAAADHIVERGDGPLRSDYATYAGDIAAAGRHLLSVIRSMGRSAANEAEPIEVGRLAAEAVGLLDPLAAERAIVIALAPLAAPLLATGEARAVVQVLVNIIGNAVRHSPAGGRIDVLFERGTDDIRITVADQGPGIAHADQQRIFERYERVGSAPDGSGLGLAISRRLARSMGGDIRLSSEPGQGARFTLTLPAS